MPPERPRRRPCAHLDRPHQRAQNLTEPLRRLPVLVVASVDERTPPLAGADWVRIDGARGDLETHRRLRARHGRPTLFDVPGPRTPRESSLLTHSEYLVHAAAQGFEWVNLRGVHDGQELEFARRFLPPDVRLTASLQSPRILGRTLDAICEQADALLVHLDELRRAAGETRLPDLTRVALIAAAAHGCPAFLTSGLFEPPRAGRDLERGAVDRLCRWIDEGYRGLILDRETLEGEDPRGSVAVARLVAEHARTHRLRAGAASRGGARIIGHASLLEPGRAQPDPD